MNDDDTFVMNNLENLEKQQVFGDPRNDYPTYLMRSNQSITTGQITESVDQGSNGQHITRLTIDSDKLLNQRRLYTDPEGPFEEHRGKKEFKNCFFILGGIPKEAIKLFEVKENVSSEWIQVNYDEFLNIKKKIPQCKLKKRITHYRIFFDSLNKDQF